ncbi:ABC transporter ATP-binding protein [Tissierella praeacuta]|uniref:Putative ABC transport system ATP-binding protein n=1 Tax=Tissierella praeacuta DSM 18095 TaxID=1123404 RepID=A0A1M4ZXN8_9FIRM|nr:ATP-binding cassette domain-containing protein [Tissierella praeacuta]TCU74163.1 putative ABC transport system ATP-binding protein [Tissierella praeacuta]SHF22406.1 putative ABC transport system ATP-binding protein [Tissierella praeacuta DSM 18095]SUP03087.1 Bicarbonate transport ATP-binding protein CmpC [Tissierella praeacuta]
MLKIVNLSKNFNKNTDNEINIFNNFNLDIEKNKCTAIIGSNGCGKSTLLNLIGGSILADKGQIILNGKSIEGLKEEQRAIHIGRVYQNPSMGVSPSLTILENMSLADKKGTKFTLRKLIKKNNIDKYIELLKDLDLGLENKLNTKVKFLSGGQRQSLSLVMAAMKHPDLLLLDEHTAALDPKTSNVVMQKTKELIKKNSMTTIMISHNMKDAIEYSDRIIMLDKGQIVLDKPSINVTEKELFDIYREKLVENVA